MIKYLLMGLSCLVCLPLTQAQDAAGFEQWKDDFVAQASAAGISLKLLSDFQQTVQFYPQALNSDKSQSEFKKFLWDYLNSAVSATRVQQGQKKYAENQALLQQITQQTGVSAATIVAIWGMESSYGQFTGNVPVMSSMATLAYEGRRQHFFEKELIAALQLYEQGDILSLSVKGSWAGGLGMTQFIPTTYQRYAIDFNADGRRDLWQVADALASTGNYLSQMGWVEGYRWGREVSLSANFDYRLANDKTLWLSLSDWGQRGIKDAYGHPLAAEDIQARLFVPAGQYGPKFLLYKNFDVIKRYNNSDAYALGVALLSEQIAGRAGLVGQWPSNAKRLRKDDIKAIQWILNQRGYSAGVVDGIFGNVTRRALQSYQAANGQVADGFLSVELFRELTSL